MIERAAMHQVKIDPDCGDHVDFQRCTDCDIRQAISLAGVRFGLRKAICAVCEVGGLEPIPMPAPHEWLSVFKETGQTFDQFVVGGHNEVHAKRRRILLVPSTLSVPLPLLHRMALLGRAFFPGMKVEVGKLIDLTAADLLTRDGEALSGIQVCSSQILNELPKHVPSNAHCMLCITDVDMYPANPFLRDKSGAHTWEPLPGHAWIGGVATPRGRCGIFSLKRLDPRTFSPDHDEAEAEATLLLRACKVLAHEICHMFGLLHCVHCRCLMMGSNSIEERDSIPLHLCAICLRKLQHVLGFDIAARYAQLRDICGEFGFQPEATYFAELAEAVGRSVPVSTGTCSETSQGGSSKGRQKSASRSMAGR